MNELVEFTATELVAKMKSGDVSAVEVFNAHAQVIETSNPTVNALVTLSLDRAFDEAKLADQKLARNNPAGPLHGLPYAVKDIFPTKDLRTTFGSALFESYIPESDALHVERARETGAIVIGKSNTPEFASGAQTDNAVFGITRNPRNMSKTVAGSSGGAAAALAANMVSMADGSDLGGSLRSPASVCDVVGFRPTAGQVPKRDNALPFNGLHVFGPMARCVEDIALFMSVFAGHDAACALSSVAQPIDFKAPLEIALEGTRIAISATPCGTKTHQEVKAMLNSRCLTFEAMGCAVEQACPDIADNHAAHQVVVALNAITELGEYLDDDRFTGSDRLRKFLQKGAMLTANDIIRARKIQARC